MWERQRKPAECMCRLPHLSHMCACLLACRGVSEVVAALFGSSGGEDFTAWAAAHELTSLQATMQAGASSPAPVSSSSSSPCSADLSQPYELLAATGQLQDVSRYLAMSMDPRLAIVVGPREGPAGWRDGRLAGGLGGGEEAWLAAAKHQLDTYLLALVRHEYVHMCVCGGGGRHLQVCVTAW